jgi:O-antigen/teichoic acid export membrane protein
LHWKPFQVRKADMLLGTPTRSGLLRDFGWVSGARATSAVLSLLTLGLLARTLGSTGFSHFALSLSAAQGMVTLVSFQTWQVVVRYGAGHLRRCDGEALPRLVKGCIGLDLLSVTAGILVAAATLATAGKHWGIPRELSTAILVLTLLFLLGMRSTPIGSLRLHGHFAAASSCDILVPAVRAIIAVLAWFEGWSLEALLICWGLSQLAGSLFLWAVVWGYGDLSAFFATRFSVGRLRQENPGFFAFVAATNALSTLSRGRAHIAILLTGLAGGAAIAGPLRVSMQIGQSAAKIAPLAERVLLPELSRLLSLGDADAARNLLARLHRFAIFAGIAALLIIAVVGPELLKLVLGEPFHGGRLLIVMLGGAAALDMAAATFQPSMLAAGRAGLVLLVRLAAMSAMALLIVAFLPLQPNVATGIGLLVASLVSYSLLRWLSRETLARECARTATADPPST